METPKTPYGLEEHLSTLCQQAPQFKNLHSSWELNKRSCVSALKQVAQNYPHYSVHDELHSQNVVSNMEQLLGEDRLCKLSPTDTWRLLQLAYLHDFGMLLLYDNIEQEWESADFQEYLLGQLSLLHTCNQEDVLKLDYISNGYAADYIHPRFLAEMLRLGDLLDADNSRFEPTAELVTGELPQDSAAHKGKHEATIHLLITPEQIEYRADCPNHSVYRETRVFLDWLESELTFAAINWLSLIPKELGGTAPRLTKKELLLNGKPDIENTSDLRFGISQEKAFEIIEGSGIYNDKMIFLRELIQNAEDASKIQLWRDLQKRPDLYLVDNADKNDLSHLQPYDIKAEAFDSYKITVDMRQEPDEKFRIRIIDRGTGMSVDTVKQMCRVGTSYHQDKARRREIEAMPAWLRPTAGFGIGLQSVFLVAPVFTIYSRPEEGAIKVTVESRKKEGYVQIEKGEFWEEQGTCVEVVFDQLQINIPMKKSYDPFGEDSGTADTIYKDFCDNMKHWVELSWFPVDITQDCLLLKKIRNELWNDFQPGDCQQKGPFLVTQTTYEGIQVWDRRLTRCSILSLVLMHLHRSICL
ncbi:ATP-binding protein [Acutalibacter muris]|nr:ATP-binding protein [Acutalibacter muris]QQR31509.1 ATP-binding protein [Acutalibacter muris]